jgi:hypothetical protein
MKENGSSSAFGENVTQWRAGRPARANTLQKSETFLPPKALRIN